MRLSRALARPCGASDARRRVIGGPVDQTHGRAVAAPRIALRGVPRFNRRSPTIPKRILRIPWTRSCHGICHRSMLTPMDGAETALEWIFCSVAKTELTITVTMFSLLTLTRH